MSIVVDSQKNDSFSQGIAWQLLLLLALILFALFCLLLPISSELGIAALCIAAGLGLSLFLQQLGSRQRPEAASAPADYRSLLHHLQRSADEEPGRVAAVLGAWLTEGALIADNEADSGDAEQAAVLLTALSSERAAAVLRELRPQHVQRAAELMSRLNAPDASRLTQILQRFERDSLQVSLVANGKADQVRDLLSDALGEDKAALLRRQLAPHGQSGQIGKLKWLSAQAIVDMLRREHPQIQAVLIACLESSQAAEVLMSFTGEKREDLLARLAALESLSPAALEELDYLIEEHLQNVGRGRQPMAGESLAAALLNELDMGSESQLLEGLRQRRPALAERVEERMFSFDQLTRLSGDDLRTVLEQFEAETIHFAVQGSSGELRERMLAVLQEVYPDYRAVAGRADLAQIKRAQQELLVATKRLAQVGEIVLERRPLSPAAKVVAQ